MGGQFVLCYYEIMSEDNLLQGNLPPVTPNIAAVPAQGVQEQPPPALAVI